MWHLECLVLFFNSLINRTGTHIQDCYLSVENGKALTVNCKSDLLVFLSVDRLNTVFRKRPEQGFNVKFVKYFNYDTFNSDKIVWIVLYSILLFSICRFMNMQMSTHLHSITPAWTSWYTMQCDWLRFLRLE